MRNTFDVEIENPDDGTIRAYRVTADGREDRAFESQFQTTIVQANVNNTFLAQFAWLASRRKGLFDGTWEEFDAQAAMVELVPDPETGEVQPEDPTRPAAEVT